MSLRHNYPVVLASILFLGGCADRREADPPGEPQAAAAAAVPTSPSGKGIVTGTIRVSGTTHAYVVLTPEHGDAVAPPATKPIMDQIQLTFVPNMLFARAGYPVEFRSSDEELHNINVKRARPFAPEFNVAIPPEATFEHTFKNPGFYDVNCDIHPTMSAQILVTATPHVAVAGANGTFTFDDVDPGAYLLTVYSGVQRADQPVTVVPGLNTVQVAFDRGEG